MNKYADLHIHTNASDGEFSPKEVVKMYKQHGFSAISITDHDTLEGLPEAISAGKIYDIEIISGVEISTVWENEEIHILGYFINANNQTLQSKLTEMKNARKMRIKKMVARLNELGYQITWQEVVKIAGQGAIGRPHLARVLLEKGYIETIKEAFHKLLGWGCPAFIPRYKINPQEAILIIKEAKGIPIVAHPGINLEDNLLKLLIEWGIEGIEVWHPEHSEKTSEKYFKFAKDNNLLITGGSDWHGNNKDSNFSLGSIKLDYIYIEKLKNHKEQILDP